MAARKVATSVVLMVICTVRMKARGEIFLRGGGEEVDIVAVAVAVAVLVGGGSGSERVVFMF